jgi:hypothetical protein
VAKGKLKGDAKHEMLYHDYRTCDGMAVTPVMQLIAQVGGAMAQDAPSAEEMHAREGRAAAWLLAFMAMGPGDEGRSIEAVKDDLMRICAMAEDRLPVVKVMVDEMRLNPREPAMDDQFFTGRKTTLIGMNEASPLKMLYTPTDEDQIKIGEVGLRAVRIGWAVDVVRMIINVKVFHLNVSKLDLDKILALDDAAFKGALWSIYTWRSLNLSDAPDVENELLASTVVVPVPDKGDKDQESSE